jgi:hypothetical protein
VTRDDENLLNCAGRGAVSAVAGLGAKGWRMAFKWVRSLKIAVVWASFGAVAARLVATKSIIA